ncbi:hypothetical protein HDV06_003715 [Boothiomyces sp. JEL0866]|nr:hypothetical protein HDV06_003699 [Boothiomyces sp. JEL0866]KAJ3321978.1 hypothetical protein HDV06_003715 [Boothiomyces sp. JEL0866]
MNDLGADEIIKQVKEQIELENFKTMISNVIPKCFNLCVLKPGLKLASSEQVCLEKCSQQYQQTMLIITSVYMQRLQKDQQSQ